MVCHAKLAVEEVRMSIAFLMRLEREDFKTGGSTDVLVFSEALHLSSASRESWLTRDVFCCFWMAFGC